MKKRKIIIRVSIALIVILVIVLAYAKKKGMIGEQPGTKVTVENVQKRTIVEIVSASGKIQPEVEVKLSPDISGEVVELHVKEGDFVKKGQLLAKINPEIYMSNFDRIVASLNMQKANLSNSRARLAQTQAQFLNSKTNYERNKSLLQQNAISQSDYDAVRASFLVAEAEVEAAEQSVRAAEFSVKSSEAAVKEARENLSKTSIYSPMEGTISKLSIEKGERVVGTSQFAGTEIMRIANLSSMEVNVSVAENDIVRVNFGDTAMVEVDAYLNRKFKGLVTSIATSANLSGVTADQVTSFEVRIRILPESYTDLMQPGIQDYSPFRPGMSATVDIQTQTEMDVLSVPIQAVTTRADTLDQKKSDTIDVTPSTPIKQETIEYVFVFVNDKAKLTPVKTGVQDNMYIQILEGLDEQTEVITGPYRAVSTTLKDGNQVKKVDRKGLFTAEK
ncbi:MAG: efflux RND transporter periplasmic adaptor subunit [Bacteroidales bacterium]|nr:efflux RND transporter periplasmic adaptor subunit [Bacteroidales bacterium]MDZ4203685.1 efflux RND transporter periplasmic adaptor subunit [Bacteroidales bacterium]